MALTTCTMNSIAASFSLHLASIVPSVAITMVTGFPSLIIDTHVEFRSSLVAGTEMMASKYVRPFSAHITCGLATS